MMKHGKLASLGSNSHDIPFGESMSNSIGGNESTKLNELNRNQKQYKPGKSASLAMLTSPNSHQPINGITHASAASSTKNNPSMLNSLNAAKMFGSNAAATGENNNNNNNSNNQTLNLSQMNNNNNNNNEVLKSNARHKQKSASLQRNMRNSGSSSALMNHLASNQNGSSSAGAGPLKSFKNVIRGTTTNNQVNPNEDESPQQAQQQQQQQSAAAASSGSAEISTNSESANPLTNFMSHKLSANDFDPKKPMLAQSLSSIRLPKLSAASIAKMNARNGKNSGIELGGTLTTAGKKESEQIRGVSADAENSENQGGRSIIKENDLERFKERIRANGHLANSINNHRSVDSQKRDDDLNRIYGGGSAAASGGSASNNSSGNSIVGTMRTNMQRSNTPASGAAKSSISGALYKRGAPRQAQRVSAIAGGTSTLVAAASTATQMASAESLFVQCYAHKTQAGCNMQGPKKNQDNFIIHRNLNALPNRWLFAVCDGHGVNGHDVSAFIRKTFPPILEGLLSKDLECSDCEYISECFRLSFLQLSHKLLESPIDCSFSGSTFVAVLIIDGKMWCANTGDSRAVLCKQANAIWNIEPLSIDHKADDPAELARIERMGGRVDSYRDYDGDPVGPARVWMKDEDIPGLAMSRSFGDLIAASCGVISDPDVRFFEIEEDDRFVVIASDGVWEFLENRQVMVHSLAYYNRMQPDLACFKLVSEATAAWKKNDAVIDDITAICVFLHKKKPDRPASSNVTEGFEIKEPPQLTQMLKNNKIPLQYKQQKAKVEEVEEEIKRNDNENEASEIQESVEQEIEVSTPQSDMYKQTSKKGNNNGVTSSSATGGVRRDMSKPEKRVNQQQQQGQSKNRQNGVQPAQKQRERDRSNSSNDSSKQSRDFNLDRKEYVANKPKGKSSNQKGQYNFDVDDGDDDAFFKHL